MIILLKREEILFLFLYFSRTNIFTAHKYYNKDQKIFIKSCCYLNILKLKLKELNTYKEKCSKFY